MKSLLNLFICLLASSCSLPANIMFRSAESRTRDGQPVINQIHFSREGSRDVWMMNQSHDGGASFERLAIVVENKTAKFYQLEPGPLEWSNDLPMKQREYRVSCALCHSNGPRGIRPQEGLSVGEKMRVAIWNLKIKMYPRLVSEAGEAFTHKISFKFEGRFANTPLKVATCTYCHRENGPIARGTLVRQNALTIASMVERGEMPPLGIPLPASERKELARFLNGF